MTPELRLIRYFVAVAETSNISRAAERLHIAQPSLSAAIKQLEQQLGVELLTRHGRGVAITPAGARLLTGGRELLEHADAVAADVRRHDATRAGRLRLGLSPTARYGLAPRFLAACAAEAPALMLYTSEDTTGALLRDLAQDRLDLAITFCAPDPPPAGIELTLLQDEPAVVHLPADHPLAARRRLSLHDVADETILVAASLDSSGFTERVLAAFAEQGIAPRVQTDPYPDLGLQAVRERVGIVVYARSAFPPTLDGSAFVALEPPLGLPFHLAARANVSSGPARTILGIASTWRAKAAR
jgi:DNA-binding transcriptional LysR family regulator